MKKYYLIVLVAVSLLCLLIDGAKLLSPGSYADAEKFELSIGQSEFISLIEKFKGENPQYKVPHQVGLSDGKQNPQDHWYHVYFYYPKENQIIYAWARSQGKQKTIFAFVSVNDGLELGKWKDINKDFSSAENREQKEKFEGRILDRLKKLIQN